MAIICDPILKQLYDSIEVIRSSQVSEVKKAKQCIPIYNSMLIRLRSLKYDSQLRVRLASGFVNEQQIIRDEQIIQEDLSMCKLHVDNLLSKAVQIKEQDELRKDIKNYKKQCIFYLDLIYSYNGFIDNAVCRGEGEEKHVEELTKSLARHTDNFEKNKINLANLGIVFEESEEYLEFEEKQRLKIEKEKEAREAEEKETKELEEFLRENGELKENETLADRVKNNVTNDYSPLSPEEQLEEIKELAKQAEEQSKYLKEYHRQSEEKREQNKQREEKLEKIKQREDEIKQLSEEIKKREREEKKRLEKEEHKRFLDFMASNPRPHPIIRFLEDAGVVTLYIIAFIFLPITLGIVYLVNESDKRNLEKYGLDVKTDDIAVNIPKVSENKSSVPFGSPLSSVESKNSQQNIIVESNNASLSPII